MVLYNYRKENPKLKNRKVDLYDNQEYQESMFRASQRMYSI